MRTLIILSVLTVSTSVAVAQTYSTQIIRNGLESPRGIAVNAAGDLYFTEVPTPGIPGTMGGTNRVNRVDGATGTLTVVETGMPEPLNIAMAGSSVYWTCRTAGVVFQFTQGSGQIAQSGLTNPTGVFAMPGGVLYVTQIPTPGVPGSQGGMNTVDVIQGGTLTAVSMGEPEPHDVVVDGNGIAYWTCRTAGVIVRRDTNTGDQGVLVRGLEQPTGLAVDAAGNLYVTEVPTPGISGTAGGRNKIWKLDPDNLAFTLISIGEPEPTDVTVTPDGSSVYWTCTTAGVIIRADRTGDAPTITTFGDAGPGTTLRFFLDAPANPGQLYVAASSFNLGAVPIDSRYVGLDEDALFAASLLDADTPAFVGYMGLLDANGMGTAQLAIPNDPMLVGMRFATAFVVVDTASPSNVAAISATVLRTVN